MQLKRPLTFTAALGVAPLAMSPIAAQAATVANPLCPVETAIYAPGHAQDIVVPPGFRVSVFARGLNQPTGIAFQGNKNNFKVYVLESGHGIPSRCNEQGSFGTGTFDPTNPFTPDVLVFDKFGNKIAGPLFKPAGSGTT
jgi:glucose/arabinose dehydrogenase